MLVLWWWRRRRRCVPVTAQSDSLSEAPYLKLLLSQSGPTTPRRSTRQWQLVSANIFSRAHTPLDRFAQLLRRRLHVIPPRSQWRNATPRLAKSSIPSGSRRRIVGRTESETGRRTHTHTRAHTDTQTHLGPCCCLQWFDLVRLRTLARAATTQLTRKFAGRLSTKSNKIK